MNLPVLLPKTGCMVVCYVKTFFSQSRKMVVCIVSIVHSEVKISAQ